MAMPVEIVRPKHSLRTLLIMIAGQIGGVFLSAWVLMFLLPIVWRPVGYWWALAAVLIVRNVLPNYSYYKLWTREQS